MDKPKQSIRCVWTKTRCPNFKNFPRDNSLFFFFFLPKMNSLSWKVPLVSDFQNQPISHRNKKLHFLTFYSVFRQVSLFVFCLLPKNRYLCYLKFERQPKIGPLQRITHHRNSKLTQFYAKAAKQIRLPLSQVPPATDDRRLPTFAVLKEFAR